MKQIFILLLILNSISSFAQLPAGQQAPDFNVYDTEGNPHHLDQ